MNIKRDTDGHPVQKAAKNEFGQNLRVVFGTHGDHVVSNVSRNGGKDGDSEGKKAAKFKNHP